MKNESSICVKTQKLVQTPNQSYSLVDFHYKKNELLRWTYCGKCENCRYMSPIVAGFWPAAVHEIYCGVLYARRNGSSILRRTTATGHSPVLAALSIDIAAAAICIPFCGGLDRHNRPLNFPAEKFSSIFFAFALKDQMVNYT